MLSVCSSPKSVSSPDWPRRESLPPLPTRVSSKLPPRSRSLPPRPNSVSPSSRPVIVSAPEVPDRLSGPLVTGMAANALLPDQKYRQEKAQAKVKCLAEQNGNPKSRGLLPTRDETAASTGPPPPLLQ